MDLRRLRAGEWIAAASGVVLLASLFLPWYAAEGAPGADLTAFQSLAVLDIVLALISALAVLLLVVTATQRVPALGIAMSALVALAGIVAVVLVAIRVADLPDGAAAREWALWAGLAGAVGIGAGGALAMGNERISPPGRHTDATGRPAPPPGEIETIPAPPPR
jgi:hypothetical protein